MSFFDDMDTEAKLGSLAMVLGFVLLILFGSCVTKCDTRYQEQIIKKMEINRGMLDPSSVERE